MFMRFEYKSASSFPINSKYIHTSKCNTVFQNIPQEISKTRILKLQEQFVRSQRQTFLYLSHLVNGDRAIFLKLTIVGGGVNEFFFSMNFR